MSYPRTLTAIVAVVVLALSAASVQAKIVRGQSIGPVSVGDREREVRQRLGSPIGRQCYDSGQPEGGTVRICSLQYRKGKLTVSIVGKKVAQIQTTARSQQTAEGAHVGMTRAQLDEVLPSCRNPDRNYCLLGRTKRTGDRYTVFFQDGKRISRIAVGRWDRRFECALGCG